MRYYTRYYDTDKADVILHNILLSLFDDDDEEEEKKKVKSKKKDKVIFKDVRPQTRLSYPKKDAKNFKPLYIPEIKNVLFNPPDTVVWFEDGSKTTAVAGYGDKYDKEVGLATCMIKRVLGNQRYREIMDEWCYKKNTLDDAVKEMLS